MRGGLVFVVVVVFLVVAGKIQGLNTEKKDGDLVPGGDGSGIKCTSCSSCENPCNQHPSSPPPSPPPPPKTPSKNYCPPPPAPYIYITGPPGNLYPFDPYYKNSASGNFLQLAIVFLGSLFCFLVFLRF